VKIEDVPQDKGYMIEGKISDLNYAVDKDGHYTSKQSRGWKPKIEAMAMAWDVVFERTEDARKQVLSGIRSPLAFYMELNIMDVSILASYTGVSKWKVRRHLKMKHFIKIRPAMLAKYAEVFNLTPAELIDTERIRTIVVKHDN
jgi:hypothetical protein